LNTKYFIIENQGETLAQTNPDANGNAWFVNKVVVVNSANEEIKALDSIPTKTTAVMNTKFAKNLPQTKFKPHPEDYIKLTAYQPNKLKYEYHITEDQLAVFSEMYYPYGWQVEVDGKELELLQADYVLRAVLLPKGEHEITFTFDPKVVKVGSSITLASGIIFGLLVIGGIFFKFRKVKPTA